MKTLLVYPPKYQEYNASSEISREGLTLGIAYISAYLNFNNFQADLIDAPYQGVSSGDIISSIHKNNYTIIGISMSIQDDVPDTIALAEEIKQHFPSVFIFVGGHFATLESELVMQNVKAIDCVVHGEGEITSLRLVRALSQGKPLSKVDSISYRINNKIVHNDKFELIKNLDDLPFPISELRKISKIDETTAYIAAQRGCYSNCSFCSISSFYKNKVIRSRSACNIVDEIEQYYKNYNIRAFKFVDDTFACMTKEGLSWILDFCEEIKKRNLSIKFEIQLRITDCKKEILEPLMDVGLDSVGLGIENFSDKVLARLNKNLTVFQIKEALNVTDDLGVKIRPLLMMFEPDMTFEELQENFIFIKSLKGLSPFNIYNFTKPFSGTPLRAKLLKEKRLIINNWYDVGKPIFLDPKVQKAFNELMKTREIFRIKQKNDVATRKSQKILVKYLELEYNLRVKLRDNFILIYELNEQKSIIMANTSIEIMNEIIRCIRENLEIDEMYLKKLSKNAITQIEEKENTVNNNIKLILEYF